jgi:glycerol uptake facilitator-like aquaporin
MNCVASGLLGTALLAGSFATLTVTEAQHARLRAVVSPEVAKTYERIITERRNQYMQGLALGIVIAFAILFVKKPAGRFHRAALTLAVTLLVAVIYYTLMPKTDYMLNHLKTAEENRAWLDVYKTMKFRYTVGFLLGTVAAIPLTNVLC